MQVNVAQREPSYYTASLGDDPLYPALKGEVQADVVVIGGGFTGVNTALELAERGFQVVLLETHRIGWGASGRNGGQVTGSLSGEDALRRQMRNWLGGAVEDFIWSLRWRGQDIIRERIKRYAIDCDLKQGHIHAALKPAHMRDLTALYEMGQARGLGADLRLLNAADMAACLDSPLYCGGLRNQRNLHLHPLKLCVGEARAASALGVQVFEGSEVLDIQGGVRPCVRTRQGCVRANEVILAGDVYHRLAARRLSGMIFPATGGIIATAPLGDMARQINPEDVAVYDCRFVLDYYRLTADGRLLFGGGAHYSGRPLRDIASELRPCIERTFPRLKGVPIDFQWSCAMGIVLNRIPQLGRLEPHVWYCQGYSGHGVATSHVAAEIMAEAVSGSMARFDALARCRHWRLPVAQGAGNALLSLGMWYYLLLERLR